jgi:hypothetical protein
MTNTKSNEMSLRPFGLQFLETVATEKLESVAGGAKAGNIVTTQAISAPSSRCGRPDRF